MVVCWPINPCLDLLAAGSDAQGQQSRSLSLRTFGPPWTQPTVITQNPFGGVLTQSAGSPAFLITQALFVTYHCFLSWGLGERVLFC